jgi:phospholipase C
MKIVKRAAAPSLLSDIDHIVVLMLENRSFDHMLGFLYPGNKTPSGQPFDGLTGTESNPDANGKAVKVYKIKATDSHPYFMPGADPAEGYAATNLQLFGTETPAANAKPANQGFVTDFATAITADMNPARHRPIMPGTTASDIMAIYTPQLLPVMSTLARSYAVSDRWFASAPTETFPNRAFVAMATSQGTMNDDTSLYTAKPIFQAMDEAPGKPTWVIYGDKNHPLTQGSIQYLKNLGSVPNIGLFTDFSAAAANGTLANYVFLEPTWGTKGNSQHPNYDVSLGEQIILDVYNTLRTSPVWNKTLLIIVFDEHGGCYDHVPPPYGAAVPDDSTGEYGFDFKRFGVRVPAILVSPLIAPNTVLRAPASGPPFDHTSILKTIEKRFGAASLTARDAAAPDLGAVLTLKTPRTDNPLAKVKAPKSVAPPVPLGNAPDHIQLTAARNAARMHVAGERKQHAEDMPRFRSGKDAQKWTEERTKKAVATAPRKRK